MTENDLFKQVENIKPDRSEEDVLYEILLKYGLDLTLPITEHILAGHCRSKGVQYRYGSADHLPVGCHFP